MKSAKVFLQEHARHEQLPQCIRRLSHRYDRRGSRRVDSSRRVDDLPAAERLDCAAMTVGCGRLPDRAELERQLRDAGYTAVRSRSLVPTDRFYAFTARTGVA